VGVLFASQPGETGGVHVSTVSGSDLTSTGVLAACVSAIPSCSSNLSSCSRLIECHSVSVSSCVLVVCPLLVLSQVVPLGRRDSGSSFHAISMSELCCTPRSQYKRNPHSKAPNAEKRMIKNIITGERPVSSFTLSGAGVISIPTTRLRVGVPSISNPFSCTFFFIISNADSSP